MAGYNGQSIMWLEQCEGIDKTFSTDACLEGIGGHCFNRYFHKELPAWVFEMGKNVHIVHLELLAIVVGVRLWKKLLTGQRFVVGCDNQAVVTIINTRRSKNKLLQVLLRELMFALATAEAELFAVHVMGSSNEISDTLSRYHLHVKYQEKFNKLKGSDWEQDVVDDKLLKLSYNW